MQNAAQGSQSDESNFVEVAVHTTSGSFPEEGYDRHNVHQPLRQALKQAEKKLNITDSVGWVALINEQKVNPEGSYADLGLSGKVDVDWGPEEGGGGCMS